MNKTDINIKQFLDKDGRIVRLPAKYSVRITLLEYLAEKFEIGKRYKEKEVNAICDCWHTFQDYFVLRRSLVDEGFLMREKDGSYYWRNEDFHSQKLDREANKYE